MDYKRRTIFYVCVFAFVGIWNFISSADISFTSYHYESRVDGYRCVPNETTFEMDNVLDAVRCGRLCFIGYMCRSVFYQPDSHKCIGCRINSPNPTCGYEPYPGSKYFRSKPTYTQQENNVALASGSDCKDICELTKFGSGLYEINLRKSKKEVTVFCDMDTDGGGWTVFQNRFDGSTDFNRSFSEFENGFGELDGEFWLGLEVIREMTSQGKTELRVDLTAADDTTAYVTFQNFYLDEGPRYTLHIGSSKGTAGDEGPGLSQNDGGHFTTYDVDQDLAPSVNMAVFLGGGGWWHTVLSAGHVTLNGEYVTPGTQKVAFNGRWIGMLYWRFKAWTSLKSSKMMFRRVNA